jgi:hypothetical protein
MYKWKDIVIVVLLVLCICCSAAAAFKTGVIEGPQGIQGEKGETGAVGPRGEQGPQGVQGETGLTGAKGEKGDKGDLGEQGPQGIQGEAGKDGKDGKDGLTPYIGEDGLWYIGAECTGVAATEIIQLSWEETEINTVLEYLSYQDDEAEVFIKVSNAKVSVENTDGTYLIYGYDKNNIGIRFPVSTNISGTGTYLVRGLVNYIAVDPAVEALYVSITPTNLYLIVD